MGISGIESDIAAWSYVPKNNDETGGQIDLVIQRADRVINLCEMKYSSVPSLWGLFRWYFTPSGVRSRIGAGYSKKIDYDAKNLYSYEPL